MGKAARAPAAVGSLVWKAAGLSSLSGYLYARLMRHREKKPCLKIAFGIGINHEKESKHIRTWH